MSIIFVDTETTGLNPRWHEIWEIALIEEGGNEHVWRMKPTRLEHADPSALRVNRFYERQDEGMAFWSAEGRDKVAWHIAKLTAGRHLVGAVPSFDAEFLTRFLAEQGFAPSWHYHLVDVETLVAGKLGIRPPWNSTDLSNSMGIPDMGGKHTAIGDARWARAMYEAAYKQAGA